MFYFNTQKPWRLLKWHWSWNGPIQPDTHQGIRFLTSFRKKLRSLECLGCLHNAERDMYCIYTLYYRQTTKRFSEVINKGTMGCEHLKWWTVEDKGAFEWGQWGGEYNKKHTPILFACLPPTSGACQSSYYPRCVCVCACVAREWPPIQNW